VNSSHPDLTKFAIRLSKTHEYGANKCTGPEQYLVEYRGKDDPPTATGKWKKFNTYLALFSANPDAQAIHVLAVLTRLGVKTLACSLEYSSDAPNLHADLWRPAAAQWMRIASDELARVCASG
jgi:hypothetical protein